MNRGEDRRTAAVRICVHVEGVIRDPVDQPTSMAGRRTTVIVKRALHVIERVNVVVHEAHVATRLHLMTSSHPCQDIRNLDLVFIWVRLPPERRRRAKREPIRPDGDLWGISSGANRRLLRQRFSGLFILKVAAILQAQLVAQLRCRGPQPPPEYRIDLAVTTTKAS